MTPEWDLVVIGGGPAGMTAAQYGARANLRTLVIEEMAAGGAVLLISDMENYPGFPEPVNGGEFSEAMRRQTEHFGAVFRSAGADSITKNGNYFTVETTDGPVHSLAVILATGAEHKHLDIPGEKKFAGRGVSYCATCDGPFFKGRKILVVGGGDSACDEASYLANLTDRVVMIHRRDRFRAQKALSDRVLKNPRIEVRFNQILQEISGESRVEHVRMKNTVTGISTEEDFDGVFVFIGAIPRTGLVPDLPRDGGGYVLTDQNMESPVKGLFAVGDVRATPFRQVVVACGEGAVAAHMAASHIDDFRGPSGPGAV